eukprot:Awhi_evm1s13091
MSCDGKPTKRNDKKREKVPLTKIINNSAHVVNFEKLDNGNLIDSEQNYFSCVQYSGSTLPVSNLLEALNFVSTVAEKYQACVGFQIVEEPGPRFLDVKLLYDHTLKKSDKWPVNHIHKHLVSRARESRGDQ